MQNTRGSFLGMIPTVTKNLLIINVIVFVAQSVLPRVGVAIEDYLSLHYYASSKFNLVQVVTYMFLHADVAHILQYVLAMDVRANSRAGDGRKAIPVLLHLVRHRSSLGARGGMGTHMAKHIHSSACAT